MTSVEIIDLGELPYQSVLARQEELFQKNLTAKELEQNTKNYLLLCEHPPVFTLGKSGKRSNILVSDEEMQAEYYHVNRGGDVTFHGPGQLVVYPIFDLDTFHIGLAEYIHQLEEVIIHSLRTFNLSATRLDGAAGIWLLADEKHPEDRKICAIGVRASRHITMHGLAFNINTDLTYFYKIIPCGLIGKGITSLSTELQQPVTLADYKTVFLNSFCIIFNAEVSS
jgi:lipoyl(octanoyl) transferase